MRLEMSRAEKFLELDKTDPAAARAMIEAELERAKSEPDELRVVRGETKFYRKGKQVAAPKPRAK
jgi:hypothetical protein